MTLATFHQLIANSGSWIQFSREGITDTWQTGIDSDNSYVTRASDATNAVTVNQNGNAVLTRNLDVDLGAAQTRIKAYANHNGITSYIELEAR